MCSVFGALLHNINDEFRATLAETLLEKIMGKSEARGRDGFGWSSTYNMGSNPSFSDSFRTVETPYRGIFAPTIVGMGQSFENGAVIGNFRAEPTTEFVKDKCKSDQQPYTLRAWSIVHNGTIANDKELRTGSLDTTIDSASIVETLNVHGQLFNSSADAYGNFTKCIKMLKGSYAILAKHEEHPDSLFVAANYRPVWYIKTEVGVFFASSKEYFPASYDAVMLEPYSTAHFQYSEKGLTISKHSLHPKKEKKRVLVVASGGMDSTVAASVCVKEGYDVELIHFEYGCKSEEHEIQAIRDIANYLQVPLKFFPLNIYDPKSSRLFDKESNIAGGEEGAEFAHEWVPARNLVMLSVATAYAEANGFDALVLGNNLEEAGAYPDNEPEFIRRFNDILPFAVGDGKKLEVLMPVGDLMKHEIVKLGLEVNAPLHLTWSCYKNGLQHCGKCGPCYMRRTAFEINETPEVITYEV